LTSRFETMIHAVLHKGEFRMIAWGWHAATVASRISQVADVLAFVDEIDAQHSICHRGMTIIPTSWSGVEMLREQGSPEDCIAEPLIGIEPTSVVADSTSVLEAMGLTEASCVVGVIGNLCGWQEIIQMVSRLHSAGLRADFVLPLHYAYCSQLFRAASDRNFASCIHRAPTSFRSVDVMKAVHCAWAPLVSSNDRSCGVLDVISAAWEGTPIGVLADHPVSSVPTFGKQLAWAENNFELSEWITRIAKEPKQTARIAADITLHIRDIVSPSRFIEGLQLRL